ncbi:MAG: M23 family metallopeptidase [Oligoflexia bacterium]|nr:M23 family metallopeptidase [Oligoflexia bacterium]
MLKLSSLLLALILIAMPAQSAIIKTAGQYNTLAQILTANGFSSTQANSLLTNKMVPTKWHLNPKDKFLISKNPKEKHIELRFYLDYGDDVLVFWKNLEGEGIERRSEVLTTKVKAIEGKIRGSLHESIKKQINDEWVVSRFIDAFIWDHNLRKIQRNDTFKLTVEQKYDDGFLVKYGEVLKAEITLKGQKYERLLITKDDKKFFVDPENNFEERPFYAPVDYTHVSSPFSRRRFHPVRRRYMAHLGVDFALPEGSPIYAPRSGTVKEVARRRGAGNYVSIEHEDGYISIYNHLQSAHKDLKEGQKVIPGQVIGYVGCTGFCTSPHLHFAVRRGKMMYNPIELTKPYPYAARDYHRTIASRELIDSAKQP